MSTRLKRVSAVVFLAIVPLGGLFLIRTSGGQSTQTMPEIPALPDKASGQPAAQIGGVPINIAAGADGFHAVGAGTLTYVVVMKTSTGECWALYPAEHDPSKRWVCLGSPPLHDTD
jgi:hypothetical protein